MNLINKKINRKTVKKEVKEWAKAVFFSIALCSIPMLAMADPAWAAKPKSFLNDILLGLEILGYGVGSITFLWFMYELIWGGKTLPQMKNWLIGAIGSASASTIVELFFRK